MQCSIIAKKNAMQKWKCLWLWWCDMIKKKADNRTTRYKGISGFFTGRNVASNMIACVLKIFRNSFIQFYQISSVQMMDSTFGSAQPWNFCVLTGRVIITYSWLEMTDETALCWMNWQHLMEWACHLRVEIVFRFLERGYLC